LPFQREGAQDKSTRNKDKGHVDRGLAWARSNVGGYKGSNYDALKFALMLMVYYWSGYYYQPSARLTPVLPQQAAWNCIISRGA